MRVLRFGRARRASERARVRPASRQNLELRAEKLAVVFISAMTRNVVAASLRQLDRAIQKGGRRNRRLCAWIARLTKTGPPSHTAAPSVVAADDKLLGGLHPVQCGDLEERRSPVPVNRSGAVAPSQPRPPAPYRSDRARERRCRPRGAGKTSRLLRSVKFPGPNQPELEANSTSGSPTSAAITATATEWEVFRGGSQAPRPSGAAVTAPLGKPSAF